MATKKQTMIVKEPVVSAEVLVRVTPEQPMTVVSADLADGFINPWETELQARTRECEELRKHISTLETSEAAANRAMLEARRELEAERQRR